MLIGSASHGIDAKGRIFIPSKWRDELGTTVIVTHGILVSDKIRCLFGMSAPAWEAFSEKFATLPEMNALGQQIKRMLFMNAAECEMDKQGRILIPTGLREYAGIEKEAVLVGVHKRIEIWDGAALDRHNNTLQENYDDALKKLAEFGI